MHVWGFAMYLSPVVFRLMDLEIVSLVVLFQTDEVLNAVGVFLVQVRDRDALACTCLVLSVSLRERPWVSDFETVTYIG